MADHILPGSEKPDIVCNYDTLVEEARAMKTQPVPVGVAIGYGIALGKLGAYLDSLTPSWRDHRVDTPIDRRAFNAAFTDVYRARGLLFVELATRCRVCGGAK